MSTVRFLCTIDDARESGEYFSAEVTIDRCEPPRPSKHDPGEFEFAHVYIVGLADRPGLRGVQFTEDASGDVVSELFNKFDSYHSHFILFDLHGRGKYVRRNAFKKDLEKRLCSTWSLGDEFARGVAAAISR